MQKATFAGGCFWCTEAVFQMIRGVASVKSGYAGGKADSPSYEEVSSGATGHAEAIQIEFDPGVVSYSDLLYIFFKMHDPTTLNQQGADVGTQYRSVVFYHDQDQKKEAENFVKKIAPDYDSPIVTAIEPFRDFYPAEDYHQDFYKKNPNQGYCRVVIDPKIQKLKKNFAKYLK